MNPAVHMSVREPDQYIVNLMTLQKLNTTWYERPHVTSIEAIRGANRWCLSKKDDSGNFFIVKPREDKLSMLQFSTSVSVYHEETNSSVFGWIDKKV